MYIDYKLCLFKMIANFPLNISKELSKKLNLVYKLGKIYPSTTDRRTKQPTNRLTVGAIGKLLSNIPSIFFQ